MCCKMYAHQFEFMLFGLCALFHQIQDLFLNLCNSSTIQLIVETWGGPYTIHSVQIHMLGPMLAIPPPLLAMYTVTVQIQQCKANIQGEHSRVPCRCKGLHCDKADNATLYRYNSVMPIFKEDIQSVMCHMIVKVSLRHK